jgi:predicted metalloprotease with PDZ domain
MVKASGAALVILAGFALAPIAAPALLAAQSGMTTAPTDRPTLGIGFWPHKDGIEINKVFSGSSAQEAGLTAGTIITHINGVALQGMGISAVEKLVIDATGLITLTLAGGRDVTLEKAPIKRPGA